MEQNWHLVAAALRRRLAEQDMTPKDLAEASGVSVTTIRELVQNDNPRNRQPRTLTSVSTALGWREDYLHRVLDGEADEDIRTMREHLEDIQAGIEAMERTEVMVAELNQFTAKVDERLETLRADD